MEPEHQQRVEELGLPRDAPFGVYNTPLSEKLPDCVPTLYHVVFPPHKLLPMSLKKKMPSGIEVSALCGRCLPCFLYSVGCLGGGSVPC